MVLLAATQARPAPAVRVCDTQRASPHKLRQAGAQVEACAAELLGIGEGRHSGWMWSTGGVCRQLLCTGAVKGLCYSDCAIGQE